MGSYEDTRLWKTTLGPQLYDDPISREARERLRVAYVKLRERAKELAEEIRRDLRSFTIHDITHSDALWYTTDLVISTQMTLTPAEAFVLGGAFLIHDLGMGLVAYEDGITRLRKTPGWKSLVRDIATGEGLVAKFNDERDFVLEADAKEDSQQSSLQEMLERAKRRIEEKAIEQLLRKSHAKQAAEMLTRSWPNRSSKTNEPYYLLEDSELRHTYGYLIGQIAYSHHWPIDEIESVFHRPKAIGAVPPPWQYPRDWTVEPLILSCLIRIADSCHIDASRAPHFAYAVRNPEEPSNTHWLFQGHIQQPYLSGDRLTFTSGQPFPPDQQTAWWLCFDQLKLIDKQLRETDSRLVHLGRRRLAARGVAGIEEPKFLANYIQIDDWLPRDTKPGVTNIPHLAKTLGGKALYGDKPEIPLRELIQNASDAVRARRLVKRTEPYEGLIHVRLGKEKNEETDKEQCWIEVEDDGIGMSIDVLTGPLIDFGMSYWNSSLMLNEFPDALADFHPTGKYGIGFFSVFMWGDHVKVTTRRYDAGVKDTHVLEFKKGLGLRPILRVATEEERRSDGGTCVRVWLKTPPYELGGFLGPQDLEKLGFSEQKIKEKALYNLCEYLCPRLYVNLLVQDQLIVQHPRDGKGQEQAQYEKIEQLPRNDKDPQQREDFVKKLVDRLSMGKSGAGELVNIKIPGSDMAKFVDIMHIVENPSQEDGGFACLLPSEEAYAYTFRLNAIDLYIIKHANASSHSANGAATHISINTDGKNLSTFTLKNFSVRRFIVAFMLSVKTADHSWYKFDEVISLATVIFKMIILIRKTMPFIETFNGGKDILLEGIRSTVEAHKDYIVDSKENLAVKVQNYLIEEIEKFSVNDDNLITDVEKEKLQNDFIYNTVIANIIKEEVKSVYKGRTDINILNMKKLYEITGDFENTRDENDPLFTNYDNFLKDRGVYEKGDYSIITTAGLRIGEPKFRLLGCMEGVANKAARDSAFIDESVLGNWATQQARAISKETQDKAFLYSVAQVVRACGGDVGKLPIAYDMNMHDWITRMDISDKYKSINSVALISLLPPPEQLLLELQLEQHVLVVHIKPPKDELFQTKRKSYYYTLYYIVLEALADGWEVGVEDLVKQTHSRQDDIKIGTKSYWDHETKVQQSKPWRALGYIITKKPSNSSS